jgi:3-oxo-5alpha-steroid 4-dehydrogenase
MGGGATALSGGVIYAGGTKYQRESGFDDTPEEMFNYLAAEGSAVSPETLRRFCETSNEDLEWLERHGVPHGSNAFTQKTTFPPDGYWLYYSGNEKLPSFAARAKPAPRGHRTLTPGSGGHLHFARLRESALAHGVKLLPHSPVRRLVVDTNNTVIGVEINAIPECLWERHAKLYSVVQPWRPFNADRAESAIAACKALEATVDNPRLIRAREGVVLSTGGFIYNLDCLRQHHPVLANNYRNLLRLGSMGDDGSGLKLGESVGSTTAYMQRICVARIIAPPNEFPYGIIVNGAGQRFVAEDAYAFVVGNAVAEQRDGVAWLILGAKDFWKGVRQSLFIGGGLNLFLMWGLPALINIAFGGTRRASTLAALARKCGIDAAGLEETVAAYNALARAKQADPLGKAPELIRPLPEGAYYAVNLCVSNKFAPAQTFTLGGLIVDEATGTVKRADGTLVQGLYAAGRVAVGVCSNGYISGLSIADTVFSGRRAGRMSAQRSTGGGAYAHSSDTDRGRRSAT